MNKKILTLLIVFLVAMQISQAASLRLPAILGSHMVLQQKARATFWGWAKPGAKVTVKAGWDAKSYVATTAADGKWKLKIQTPHAGGPYTIKISADTTYQLSDVLIGEVWICSGQSNMEMPLIGFTSQPIGGSIDYIAKGYDDNLRLFTVAKKISTTPLDDCGGKWSVSDPAGAASFSAVGYLYGKYLKEILGIPFGMIHTSWGGTPAESWTDEATIRSEFPEFDLSALSDPSQAKAGTPTVLFNGMIHPLLNFPIRGAIWYQGESNHTRPEQYARLFPAMIENWRQRWDEPDFPFYFVQIAPYKYSETANSAFLRETQLKTMQTVANTGMAVTMDIGEKECIHPAEKILVGKRLAYNALATTYGFEGLPFNGPVFKEMKTDGSVVTLVFDYADKGLTSFGKELTGFTVAGADRKFYPAVASIKGKDLVVTSNQVTNPVAVRYCWENWTVGTLYNIAGLPASSFRTDNWEK